MSLSPARRALSVAVSTTVVAGLLSAAAAAGIAGAAPVSAAPIRSAAPAAVESLPELPAVATAGTVTVENSFVSAVGWVKPGTTYPSRIIVRNTGTLPASALTVKVTAPQGSTILRAGDQQVGTASYTWTIDTLAGGASRTLVLLSRAASTADLPTVVWRDLSTTAVLTVAGASATVASHGPKVIPPGSEYDTARYGDRPFPVVPVAYTDRDYLAAHNGGQLDRVINDPEFAGSTYNLFQEMSLGQLFPHGTVPSAGIARKDFAYDGNPATGGDGAFPFTRVVPGQTCTGVTYADNPLPVPAEGSSLYPDRIRDGVYQLPGQTQYYGADGSASGLPGALVGVAALMQIDSGCGPTGKLVVDAAAIADPEIDYSDYDTDKDGVVDFFMAVFAGCGGNGASQLGTCTEDPQDALPYDNIWPHSSSLEYYYTDPRTGLAGFTTDDQLKDLQGRPLWYTDDGYKQMTTQDMGPDLKVYVRVGPYNVNPETAIDHASVISHEYGHSLGLPDFYSLGSRETYGDWNLMATDKSQNMDAYSRQELGWVVPEVLDSSRTETAVPDSKEDIDTITWRTPDGTPYTLTEGVGGVGRVQNSQMYVAKLPGRILLDESRFSSGEGASARSLWWSRSGNDFGCASDGRGHNVDIALPPRVQTLPEGTSLALELNSMWDIEWDYDYGYVLTSTDGGTTFASNESERGYTTSNTDPLAGNPNQNGCQATFDHGLTGTSGSYAEGTEALDRKAGNTPEMVFVKDRYDISELVRQDTPVLRFSYATDAGLARPGWFIDDVKVTATLPDGTTDVLFESDFEETGTPEDPRMFNGGCREDLAGRCTQGWQHVIAGAEGPNDHAYYLEMRDRSGFDHEGRGQSDRGFPAFEAGFYSSYTDEAHGYGNSGTDDPPAQSPLDSQPQPGNNTPDLHDAAWRPGDTPFSDASADPWVDNYVDPAGPGEQWVFAHDCLGYEVMSMSGEGEGPSDFPAPPGAGDLTGTIAFTIGAGCGTFDYGYGKEDVAANTAPTATAAGGPTAVAPGSAVSFDGSGSTDAESPTQLTYAWDFGDATPKRTGPRVTHVYGRPGTYTATLTVSDPEGLTDTATVTITVRSPGASQGPAKSPTATGSAAGATGDAPAPGDCGTVTAKVRLRIYRASDLTRVGRPKLKARLRLSCGTVTPGMGRWVVRIDGRTYRSFTVKGNTLKSLVKERRFLTSGRHTVRVVFKPSDTSRPKARSAPATYLRR